MFGVDRDYSFYCAFMSTLLAAGQNKVVFLSVSSSGRISANMSVDRMMYAHCWCNCPQIPFAVVCLLQRKAAQDNGEKRLHAQTGEGCHPQHRATKLDKKNMNFPGHLNLRPSIPHFSALAFFPFIFSIFSLSLHLSVQTLPPSLPPVSTSHFLFPPVNISTGLMCTPAHMSALEQLTAHIVGLPNPEAFSYSFSARENDRLWFFYFFFYFLRVAVISNLHYFIQEV